LKLQVFEELMMFISLFKHLDDEKIERLVASLNKSTQSLLEAEKKDKNAAQVLTDLANATARLRVQWNLLLSY